MALIICVKGWDDIPANSVVVERDGRRKDGKLVVLADECVYIHLEKMISHAYADVCK